MNTKYLNTRTRINLGDITSIGDLWECERNNPIMCCAEVGKLYSEQRYFDVMA